MHTNQALRVMRWAVAATLSSPGSTVMKCARSETAKKASSAKPAAREGAEARKRGNQAWPAAAPSPTQAKATG